MNSLNIDSVTPKSKGRNPYLPTINPVVNTTSSKNSKNAEIEL